MATRAAHFQIKIAAVTPLICGGVAAAMSDVTGYCLKRSDPNSPRNSRQMNQK